MLGGAAVQDRQFQTLLWIFLGVCGVMYLLVIGFLVAAIVRRRAQRRIWSLRRLFATSLIGGAPGALMSFSASPWYAQYAAMGVSGIGLDPVTDQQLAGLVMWIPGGMVHGIAALLLFHCWLKSAEGGHAVNLP